MSGPRRIELDAVRADGWFERVLTGVPALARVCEGLGEALVALSLAAGVRIVAAGIDRGTGEISSLEWVQDVNGAEESHAGTPDSLRSAVLATLTAYEPVPATPPEDDVDALRRWVGMRDLLLAPLFGLQLVALEFDADGEPSAWVTHEHGEEKVPYPQLRGFLRSRVSEVLRAPPRRGVSIDLEQAVVARAALDAGRFDEVVEKLGGWVPALMLYLRTPEGASMEPKQRADVARALRVLGAALHALDRDEEAEETLRLGVQWAQDGEGAPELYAALATLLGELGRWGEAIGPLRRARGLEPALPGVDADLARPSSRRGAR
ncbi:MAG: tetratricopeptide repeat protein [Polyangiales bacterium]